MPSIHLQQPSTSIKVKCTSSHLDQEQLYKPNKDISPGEINSHGPFLFNLFLSSGRVKTFPNHLLHQSRKFKEFKQLLKEIRV